MRRVFMAAIFLLTGSGVALGQTSAAAVHTRLTHGRTIAITDAQSQITTGRIVIVTPAVVSIEKADRRFDVPFSEIVAIDEIDHLRNGALVGLMWGLLVLAAFVVHDRRVGGRVHPVTIWGGGGLIVLANMQALLIGPSHAWGAPGGVAERMTETAGRILREAHDYSPDVRHSAVACH